MPKRDLNSFIKALEARGELRRVKTLVSPVLEITEIAEKIGTYETSILPYEDCCTIFVAKHPVTKPNLNIIKRHEENLKEKIDELVQQALDSDVVEIVKVD